MCCPTNAFSRFNSIITKRLAQEGGLVKGGVFKKSSKGNKGKQQRPVKEEEGGDRDNTAPLIKRQVTLFARAVEIRGDRTIPQPHPLVPFSPCVMATTISIMNKCFVSVFAVHGFFLRSVERETQGRLAHALVVPYRSAASCVMPSGILSMMQAGAMYKSRTNNKKKSRQVCFAVFPPCSACWFPRFVVARRNPFA